MMWTCEVCRVCFCGLLDLGAKTGLVVEKIWNEDLLVVGWASCVRCESQFWEKCKLEYVTQRKMDDKSYIQNIGV